MKNILKKIKNTVLGFFPIINKYNTYLNVFLTLLIFFWIFFLSTVRFRNNSSDLKVGDIALYDIKALEAVEYVDRAATQKKKDRIISKISPVFQFDLDVLEEQKEINAEFFDEVVKIDNELIDLGEKINKAKKSLFIKNKELLKTLFQNYKINNFRYKAIELLSFFYKTGISEMNYEELKNLSQTGFIIKEYNNEQGQETKIHAELKDIFYLDSIDYNAVIRKKYSTLRWDKVQFLKLYIPHFIEPNLKYDKDLTQEKNFEAISSVEPVMKKLKKGQMIVRYGDEITEKNMNIINGIMKHSSQSNNIYGYFILLFITIALSFILLKIYSGSFFARRKVFMFLLSFVFITATLNYLLPLVNNLLKAKILNSFFIPIGGYMILINQLIGYPMSIFILLFISVISVFLIGISYIDFIVILGVGLFTLIISRVLKKRNYIWYIGVIIGFFYMLLNFGTSRISNFSHEQIFNSILIGFINGISSVIISMGLYSLFENIFNMATEYKLLELSDLNLPIMKKLLIEAPGTYNHSILIANMAETAALAINANSLMARVGGYYHDIGKLENPEYFIENQGGQDNKHKKIKPSISSTIVKSHVKYGMELAKKLKLPDEIVRAVQEHHGTTTISYFYSKALQNKEDNNINKQDLMSAYRYEGPKPSTKENAIIMLADIVEAASRSLTKPSYTRLQALVKDMINDRFLDGQLSNCPLTLMDLNKIAESFSHVLAAMYHTRIEYPEKNKVEKLEYEY